MQQTGFEIKIIRQYWIEDSDLDDKNDLCSHGDVFIRIGNEILVDEKEGFWTLSATGLYLLRSLYQDYKIDQFGSQFLPCCGHFMIPDKTDNYVVIIGCPNGIDWNITHKGTTVEFETEKGTKAKLDFNDYKKLVLDFVNEIETFYGNPNEKIVLGDDESDKKAFSQFWAEWNELKQNISTL